MNDKDITKLAKEWETLAEKLYLLGYKKFSVALRKSIEPLINYIETTGIYPTELANLLVTQIPISTAMNEFVPLVADRTAKNFYKSYLKFLPESAGIAVGFSSEAFTAGMTEYLNTVGLKHITEITETTRKLVNQAFRDSLENGETTAQLVKRIEKYTGMGKSRAMLIARTETLMSSAKAKELQEQEYPFEMDVLWIHDAPKEPRSWHVNLNRQVRQGDKFKVVSPDGVTYYMKYAGDPAGGAINNCNCKCSHIYKVKRDSEGNPINK